MFRLSPHITLSIVIALVGSNIIAQDADSNPNNFIYVKTLSSATGGHERVYAACLGDMNSIYIGGRFDTDFDADPGDDTYTLTGNTTGGINCGFVGKYTEQGDFIWAFELPSNDGTTGSTVFGLSTDDDDNLVVMGQFAGTVDFDPGVGTYELTSTSIDPLSVGSIFYAKYSSAGDFIWAKKVDMLGNRCFGNKIDDAGNIYFYGLCSGTADANQDFDPGVGVATPGSEQGLWIAKYNSAGTFQWIKMPLTVAIYASAKPDVAIDGSGNIYITGSFSGSNDFDPGIGTSTLSSTGGRGFIAKYNSNGTLQYANQFGPSSSTSYECSPKGIVVNSSGEAFITGFFKGVNIDFAPAAATDYKSTQYYSYNPDPEIPEHPHETGYNYEGFLAKFSTTGTLSWCKQIATSAATYACDGNTSPTNVKPLDISIDGGGYLTISGTFEGCTDFDPDAVETAYCSTDGGGSMSNFVSKYSSIGTRKNTRVIESSASSYVGQDRNFVFTTASGSIITIGEFIGTVDFDPENTEESMIHKEGTGKYGDHVVKKMGGASAVMTSVSGSQDLFISFYSTMSMLPVSLTSLEAEAIENKAVEVNWETKSEINNDYFTVERSLNGMDFEEVNTVPGKGTSNAISTYEIVDDAPFAGQSYYRLKQTDFDGTQKTYGSVSVMISAALFGFQIFPNPSSVKTPVYLNIEGEAEEILVVVHDMSGKESYSKIIVKEAIGDHRIAIDPSNTLSPGIYTVTATSDDSMYQQRLIIK